MTSETDPNGNLTSYKYDEQNRLIQVIQPPDELGHDHPIWTIEYDSDGQIQSIEDPLDRVTTYTYDELGRQTMVEYPDPDEGDLAPAPFTLTAYNKTGTAHSTQDVLGNITTYLYNDLDRLIEVDLPDPNGDSIGSPEDVPKWLYHYNVIGELESMTDPLGGETAYEYNGLSQAILVTSPDPNGGETGVETHYTVRLQRPGHQRSRRGK